jgi:hypothetical protein
MFVILNLIQVLFIFYYVFAYRYCYAVFAVQAHNISIFRYEIVFYD